jgi:single-strand selective monofunctional uracil DNA glycosylase
MPRIQKKSGIVQAMLQSTSELSDALNQLKFPFPVHVVYNPLDYAWEAHADYISRYAGLGATTLFLGMNPGPFGMMQTGIPFGEVTAVKDWLQIRGTIKKPAIQHPKRPVVGWDCPRSEVSGRRLWGLFKSRFETPERFFGQHYVLNYCPLGFLSETGSNITPDKIGAEPLRMVTSACDSHLREVCRILNITHAVGIGGFAEKRLSEALSRDSISIGRMLHPSPASPAANKNWAATATQQLVEQKLWPAEPA